MIAADTNVLVRLLTGDDPAQAESAKRLFSENEVLILPTVLLETAWVLSAAYEFKDTAIREAFGKLLSLGAVRIADEPGVRRAMTAWANGLDFADALHASLAMESGATLGTFDKALIRKSAKAGVRAKAVAS